MEVRPKTVFTSATAALWLLLVINLFNYIDRYILAAVLPRIRQEFLAGDPNQFQKAGWLFPAFLISYMCAAPILGWLADRVSRWWLISISVALWSLASCWSGWAVSFAILLCTRAFVGIGEALRPRRADNSVRPVSNRTAGADFCLLFSCACSGRL